MLKPRLAVGLLALGILIAGALLCWDGTDSPAVLETASSAPVVSAQGADEASATFAPSPGTVEASEQEAAVGVPAVDPETTAAAADPGPAAAFDYGRTPAIPADANPSVAQVHQALVARSHPERLNPMIAPAPFDRARYVADPASYLQTVEPGRVFQTAQPAPEVRRIERLTPSSPTVVQGESLRLAVRAEPGMPVTFTSFDLGIFAENQLTSLTVAADADGQAAATLQATPGTIGDISILAASPVTSGQLRFIVTVERPQRVANDRKDI
jgi:hypothetical protein